MVWVKEQNWLLASSATLLHPTPSLNMGMVQARVTLSLKFQNLKQLLNKSLTLLTSNI